MQLNAFNWGHKFVMNLIKIYFFSKKKRANLVHFGWRKKVFKKDPHENIINESDYLPEPTMIYKMYELY